jgi:TonB family protein
VVTGKSKYTSAGFKPPVIEPEFSKPEFIPFKEALTKTLAGFKSDNPVSNDIIIYLRVSFKIGPEVRKPSSGTSSAGNSYVQPIIVDTMPDDKVYSNVEIESTYPGGAGGWQDYLYKEFRYPQAAINNEIQGTVVVQYIVDREGNLSNVVAESGPSEGGLRDEAIRVIKNSGKWFPAIQNGRKVSSYKRQPIVFKLQAQ